MAEIKKYYWLKIKDTFFDDDTIRFIEEQENGIKYSNFYLKLCLKSARTNGRLIRLVGETLIPYDVKSLANLTGVDFDTVNSAMNLFKKLGIISIMENGELYLSQVQELAGSETSKAEIMRRKRAETKALKEDGNNVTKMLPYIEIEIEKELEKDIELDIIETNFGRPMTSKEAQILVELKKDYDDDLIDYAFELAVKNNAKSLRYVETILNNWKIKGIKTKEMAINEPRSKPSYTRKVDLPEEFTKNSIPKLVDEKELDDVKNKLKRLNL